MNFSNHPILACLLAAVVLLVATFGMEQLKGWIERRQKRQESDSPHLADPYCDCDLCTELRRRVEERR